MYTVIFMGKFHRFHDDFHPFIFADCFAPHVLIFVDFTFHKFTRKYCEIYVHEIFHAHGMFLAPPLCSLMYSSCHKPHRSSPSPSNIGGFSGLMGSSETLVMIILGLKQELGYSEINWIFQDF